MAQFDDHRKEGGKHKEKNGRQKTKTNRRRTVGQKEQSESLLHTVVILEPL
jgi:hypothetical protein